MTIPPHRRGILMKRLQPLTLTAVNANECVLRCRPKFDEITEEERADLLLSMKTRAVDATADEDKLESNFTFTFNKDGGVLQDRQFTYLTSDDYGEMWIDRSVGNFARANEDGIDVPDTPGGKLRPHALLVVAANGNSARQYKVVFTKDNDTQTKEYTFTVEGGKENIRTIAWTHGSYSASWHSKSGSSYRLRMPIWSHFYSLSLGLTKLYTST